MPAVATVSVGASAEKPGGSCSSARRVAVASSLDAAPACSPVALVTTSSCWNPPRPELVEGLGLAHRRRRVRLVQQPDRPSAHLPGPRLAASQPSCVARKRSRQRPQQTTPQRVRRGPAQGRVGWCSRRPRGSPRASREQMPRAKRGFVGPRPAQPEHVAAVLLARSGGDLPAVSAKCHDGRAG